MRHPSPSTDKGRNRRIGQQLHLQRGGNKDRREVERGCQQGCWRKQRGEVKWRQMHLAVGNTQDRQFHVQGCGMSIQNSARISSFEASLCHDARRESGRRTVRIRNETTAYSARERGCGGVW